jgi:8-oxo-dGTP pyrophosphatase MutT (NUDIX family)
MRFKEFMEEAEFIGAGVIPYCETTGRYLFVRRSKGVKEPGTWAGIGGRVDEGESPELGAIREMQEEVQFDGRIDLELIYTFIARGFKYYNYIGRVDEEFIPTLNWENDNFKWIKPGEWPAPLHPGLLKVIKLL